MDRSLDLTFVVSKSGDPSLLRRNFSISPCLEGLAPDRIIIQEGFSSASLAYNDAIDKAGTDIIVFAHQDVYFPANWIVQLQQALQSLEKADPHWGVAGGFGVTNQGLEAGFLFSVGLGVLGEPFDDPVAIDTLDEYLLILRKSSGLRFDPALPGFHFYGTDICLSARQQGKRCYAIPVFCVHNTSYGFLSDDFFNYYWDIKKKWKRYLPIQTPCIRISRWDKDLIIRKLKRGYFSLRGTRRPSPRLEDPRSVLPLPSSGFRNRDIGQPNAARQPG